MKKVRLFGYYQITIKTFSDVVTKKKQKYIWNQKKQRFYLLYRNDVKMNFKIHGRFINLRSYLVHIFGPYRSILWHLKETQEVDQLKLRKSYPTTHILYVTYTVYTVCNVHKLFQQGKKYHKVPNQGLNHANQPVQTMIKPYLVIILVEVALAPY